MRKLYCVAIIITITSMLFAGCNIFWPQVYPPEEIPPILFLTGDIEDTIYVDVIGLTAKSFGADQGYPLSDVLDKAAPTSSNYDVLAVARNDKAVKLEGETIADCYIVTTEDGILELRSSVHYYSTDSFLPLRSISEIIILAQDEVERGIEVTGGTIPKFFVKKQIEFVFAQLRTYVSNNGYTVVEYRRDATYADILLSGGYTSATLVLADDSVIEVDGTTKEIIDWRNGNLILRSNTSPIVTIALEGGTQEEETE